MSRTVRRSPSRWSGGCTRATTMEPMDDIAGGIGRIMTNLLSLEFAIRLFLYELEGPQDLSFDIDQTAVGTRVNETPLTNYDALGTLIKKLNILLSRRGLAARIDESLVELRDALAHGRLLSPQPQGPFRLHKFGKPQNGLVLLTCSINISSEWIAMQIRRTSSEIRKTVILARSLGLASFPD